MHYAHSVVANKKYNTAQIRVEINLFLTRISIKHKYSIILLCILKYVH